MVMTYVNLNDLRHAGTSSSQDSLDVIAADLGLVTDAALDQGGRGIGGDLTGDKDLAVGSDSLGLFIVSLVLSSHLGCVYSGAGQLW